MNPERKEILSLPVLPGRLTPAEAAWRLGFEPDHIPISVSLGLLKPLGHPTASTVKYFASVEIETLRNDPKWLAKATDALRHKWKLKNEAAKRKTDSGHISSASGNGQSRRHSELAMHQGERQ
ncbi:MAG: hypothetical protein L0Y58_19230 [Verrucomicrobia subdivision 3 bacterium]|nr:hypothetical protein [Limisphaerales bacterium]